VTEPRTIAETIDGAARRLTASGVSQARLEARLLLSHAAGLSPERMLAARDRPLSGPELRQLEALLARRIRREPMAQILGRREFWSLPFTVTPDTLTPRSDSETLVEAALALVPDRGIRLRILDLGTGTGCLLLSLLSELPEAEGVGVDCSEAACRVARDNAAALGLASRARFLVGNWDDGLAGQFEFVISNPPYIPESEIGGLEPEVARFEPYSALAGGADGLAAYRALVPRLAPRLARGGHALLEVGAGQAEPVARLAAVAGLVEAGRRLDLAGIERCLIMRGGFARRAEVGTSQRLENR
jgi:release factor glutamine methyltransferase